MANTKFQIKRTSVSGRLPNTSDPANTSYIDAGELAINLTDEKVFSSNGTVTFEVGANLTNLLVSSNTTLSTIVANGTIGTSGQVLTSNGTTVYWETISLGDSLTNVDWYPSNSTLTITTTNTAISQTFNYANSTSPGLIQIVDSTSNSAANIAASANSVKISFDAAGNAYSNATSYADLAANTAYVNATSYADLAANTAYVNATSYADLAANTAYVNATSFASNADNISSGTLNTDRLPSTVNVASIVNIGSNVNLSTSLISVGNTTVNTQINSTSITTTSISGNGSSITSVDAVSVGGNTASDLRTYSDNQAGNAYSNAVSAIVENAIAFSIALG